MTLDVAVCPQQYPLLISPCPCALRCAPCERLAGQGMHAGGEHVASLWAWGVGAPHTDMPASRSWVRASTEELLGPSVATSFVKVLPSVSGCGRRAHS